MFVDHLYFYNKTHKIIFQEVNILELSQAAIRIIILVIPGLIFYKCYSSIVGTKIKKDWESFLK